jgi:hypothetical protein
MTTCRACNHFDATAQSLERTLPALASLSSAHAATRAQDGICTHHARLLPATATCPAFVPHAAVIVPG